MRALLLSCFVLLAVGAAAQVDSLNAQTSDSLLFIDPEQPPSFPGGEQAMWKFLQQRLPHPAEACAIGKVYVGFTVEVDGALTNLHLVRGLREVCDAEALKAVAEFPKWNPAMIEGKPIRRDYIIPVKFSLH